MDEFNKGRNIASQEIAIRRRFGFGKNWINYSRNIDTSRIEIAQQQLKSMLAVNDLKGLSFLDVGSGSGLMSLAAARLGARVHSFDYDPDSVACTRNTKERFLPDREDWTIEEGSILDETYVRSLGKFDIVYSWGVLHHTGDMWTALANVLLPVGKGGKLFIALYNDQGVISSVWLQIKRLFNKGILQKGFILAIFLPLFAAIAVLHGIVHHRNPLWKFRNYQSSRGMSLYHDWLDWLGGLPFEVARADDVFRFCFSRGYALKGLTTRCGSGNNEFVFQKDDSAIA
jgi:2-polyprenyl-6-hydroxyphenyl methylase/3-demethylubiquinone-9 3-methyltransferase